MAERIAFQTPDAMDFSKVFSSLCQHHNPWTIWSDFITMHACVISIAFDRYDPMRFKERSELFRNTAKQYSEQELTAFDSLFKTTAASLNRNPQQDFLGRLYMSLDFGSRWTGQFFTPWNVAYMMAEMTVGPDADILKDREYASICDPCCGAGCMLLAAAAAYADEEKNRVPQRDLLLVGQDVDRIVALMCYIQLSLLGYAGYVAIGNSLTNPVTGTDLFPQIGESGELWFTPGWFAPIWDTRRQIEYIKRMTANLQTAKAFSGLEGGEG